MVSLYKEYSMLYQERKKKKKEGSRIYGCLMDPQRRIDLSNIKGQKSPSAAAKRFHFQGRERLSTKEISPICVF